MSENRETKSKFGFISYMTLNILSKLILILLFYYASLGYSELMLIYESSSNIQLFFSSIYIIIAVFVIKSCDLLTNVIYSLWKKN